MTDISCTGCMLQDIQIKSTGFLSVVYCLTNVKLLPPALVWKIQIYPNAVWNIFRKRSLPEEEQSHI